MAIAQQSATPNLGIRSRAARPPVLVAVPRPRAALAKIVGLIGLASLGAAAVAGMAGIGVVMLMSKLGG